MSGTDLATMLKELGVEEFVTRAGEAALARVIASTLTSDTEQPNPERLPRLAFLYETEGVSAFQRAAARRGDED